MYRKIELTQSEKDSLYAVSCIACSDISCSECPLHIETDTTLMCIKTLIHELLLSNYDIMALSNAFNMTENKGVKDV